jgi:hypothetical protein
VIEHGKGGFLLHLKLFFSLGFKRPTWGVLNFFYDYHTMCILW